MSQSALRPQQLNTLQSLITKHIADPSLADFAVSNDFAITSTERGVNRWEQAHLVAALDVLNAYQSDRRARAACQVAGHYLGKRRQFTDDPRTRAVEFLKRWLRTRAADAAVGEDEVRGFCGLCRDILNHPQLFPARNPRSFLCTIAEVYEHLQWQLREVLEQDHTCAELARRVLSLSRNFLSDVVSYLLLAPTDLRQTDALPSLEIVALWQSLPDEGHPLPGRADPALQHTMRDAWRSQCGSLVAAILGTPWCVSLFKGAGADDAADSRPAGTAVSDSAVAEAAGMRPGPPAFERISEVRRQFELGELKASGLAGAFRSAGHASTRRLYVDVAQEAFDLVYLLGEVLVQFHRVSDGLGDYGMIRVAPWLHPFLETLTDKVHRVKSHLEKLNDAVEGAYVLARARGGKVEKPAPSTRMSARAHASIERAVTGRDTHVQALLQAIDELRARSSPERLPHVMEGLGDACTALRSVLTSLEFRARVGGSFPELPALGNAPAVGVEDGSRSASTEGQKAAYSSHLQLEDSTASNSEADVASIDSEAGAAPFEPAVVAPVQVLRGRLWADVHRLVSARCGSRLQRHDRRSLLISGGRFFIFEKGSVDKVKTEVDIQSGVESCRQGPGGTLSLTVHRLPDGATEEDGVTECKEYIFEFPDAQLAAAFHEELVRDRPWCS